MTNILKLLVLLFLSFNITFAQNLDSIYNAIISLEANNNSQSQIQVTGEGENKCAFGLFAEARSNFSRFNSKQQNILAKILERPSSDTSIVTPSGFFRIHYDISGVNKPGYSINDLAVAFDSSYNFEVNFLGYPPPPPDGNMGGDSKYDVYVMNLSGGLYGYTTPETNVTNLTYTSYIVMDNDFSNYFTQGINAARVTAAHEFHHGIQVGNYIFRDNDVWYYELTSTSMEEFVYNSVNDYYAYMPSYFNRPYGTISEHTGYDMAVWNIYLKQRFESISTMLGFNIIKRSWELMVDNRAVFAIAKSLQENGYLFGQEFNTFSLWNYFTNSRAKENEYYTEAKNYPLIRPTTTVEFIPPQKELSILSEPVSNNFIIFPDNSNGNNDTLVSIITNADLQGGIDPANNDIKFQYILSSSPVAEFKKINNFYYSKVEASKPGVFYEVNIFNGKVAGETITREEIDYAYPQPFEYSSNSFVFLPTVVNISGTADYNIYTSGMELVFSGKGEILANDKITVKWNAMNFNNAKLPTGVYIYVTKSGDTVKKGKIVIYNK